MDRKILHPAIVILQGCKKVKGLKGPGSGITDLRSGIITCGIGISSIFHGIRDQIFCGFRGQNSHHLCDQRSKFWVKVWDQLRKLYLVTTLILCADQLKLQHPSPPPPPPPPLGKAWAFELLDRSNSRPLGPKWCSNARPYCQTCLSYPTKEQSSLALSVFNKDLLKAVFVSQSLTNATSLPLKKVFHLVQTHVLWLLVTSAPQKK